MLSSTFSLHNLPINVRVNIVMNCIFILLIHAMDVLELMLMDKVYVSLLRVK